MSWKYLNSDNIFVDIKVNDGNVSLEINTWNIMRKKDDIEKNRRNQARELDMYFQYLKNEMECEICKRWKVVKRNEIWICPTCY